MGRNGGRQSSFEFDDPEGEDDFMDDRDAFMFGDQADNGVDSCHVVLNTATARRMVPGGGLNGTYGGRGCDKIRAPRELWLV